MSLNSAMQDVIRVTGKLTSLANNTRNKNPLHCNTPYSAVQRVLGLQVFDDIESIQDLKSAIQQIKQKIALGASYVQCISIMGLKDWGQVLENIANGVGDAMASVLNQIMVAIQSQIQQAIGQILGTVNNLIDALFNLVNSIFVLMAAIQETIRSWFEWANDKINFQRSQQECIDMFSTIGACLLNKFLGPYIQQFTSKVVGKINQVGNNINDKIYQQLYDVNTFSAYANQQAFLLKKAALQTRGLSKTNLLMSDQELLKG